MKKNILWLLFLFFAFASSVHAQVDNCGVPTESPYREQPNLPACTGGGTFNDFAIGSVTFYCQDANNHYANYAGTPYYSIVTGYGQIHYWPFCSAIPVECDAREYVNVTEAQSPTDYNRFYNYAFDVYYNSGGSYASGTLCPDEPPPNNWRQDFFQCQGLPCNYNAGCPTTCDPSGSCPRTCDPSCCGTPIVIDTSGNGVDLTNAAGGVSFDLAGIGKPIQMAWTAPGAMTAFLCLPDPNGMCDDGKDLFGNFTPQPDSATPNGFAALAVYDSNHDGVIDSRDAIFSQLRLWIDANHDGISQPNEIFTLPALGVHSISLNYKQDGKTDQYGNLLKYRAQVNPGGPAGTGRWAYDVFFARLVTTASKGAGKITTCPAVPHLLPEKTGSLR